VGLADRRRPVVVRIVDQGDVDPVEAETGQALVDRSTDTIGAVVEHRPDGPGPDVEGVLSPVERLSIDVGAGRDLGRGPVEPADLGRQHVLVARPCRERPAESSLRGAVAVQRSHVERSDPDVPPVVDDADRLGVGHSREQPTDRRPAQPEPGQTEPGPSERQAFGRLEWHAISSTTTPRLELTPRVSLSYRSVLGPSDRILNDWE